MASATSYIVSNIHGGSASMDSKTNMAAISRPLTTHLGLRAVNKFDTLKTKSSMKTSSCARNASNDRSFGTIICGTGLNICLVSAECGPWSKTGGLGDVLSGLPPALAACAHRVMTVSPRYDQYADAWDTGVLVEVQVGDNIETVRYFHCYKNGVDRVFVDHPMFLERVWGETKSKIYGPEAGKDYDDNQLRFSLLCQAALEAPRVLDLNCNEHFSGPYGEEIVFVANDWHTAVLPCYLKSMYQSRGIYMNAKVAFCIHNIAYQGRFAASDFRFLNLPNEFKSSFDFSDGYDKPVKGRKINWLKAGIKESDRLLTVSSHYAKELVSSRAKGVELNEDIQNASITGIENGMDKAEWNPSTDRHIDYHYDISTVMGAKPMLKEDLQAAVGLPVDKNIPLIGFIGRLEEQKGSDILVAAIPGLISTNVQIIILGTGKKQFEEQIKHLENSYPDNVKGVLQFNIPMAHKITAAADFMLIPSRFEPCGLIQLHAMTYGTIPICASTGGLVDTVKEGYTGIHMGEFNVKCSVVDPMDVAKIVESVRRAHALYHTPAFNDMILNCMSQDLSWKGPAKKWESVLQSLVAVGSEPSIDEDKEIKPLAMENVSTP